MHEFELIMTITGGFTAALIFGYITHRLGMSPIVGYLLAGIAVGPHTPGFVANHALAEQFAEIGVILLMFGVGLQFHARELLDVRRVAVPGAIFQSTVATVLCCLITRLFGWSWASGIIFGIAISVASTVVLLRVLVDSDVRMIFAGQLAVGPLDFFRGRFSVNPEYLVKILVVVHNVHRPRSPWATGEGRLARPSGTALMGQETGTR